MKAGTLARIARLEQTALDATPLPPARFGTLQIDGSIQDRFTLATYPNEQAWADTWPGWFLCLIHVVGPDGLVLGLDRVEPIPPG